MSDTNTILRIHSRVQHGSTSFVLFFCCLFFESQTSCLIDRETFNGVSKPGHLRRNPTDCVAVQTSKKLILCHKVLKCEKSTTLVQRFSPSGKWGRAEKSPASVHVYDPCAAPVFISPPPSHQTFITALGGTCGSTCLSEKKKRCLWAEGSSGRESRLFSRGLPKDFCWSWCVKSTTFRINPRAWGRLRIFRHHY